MIDLFQIEINDDRITGPTAPFTCLFVWVVGALSWWGEGHRYVFNRAWGQYKLNWKAEVDYWI